MTAVGRAAGRSVEEALHGNEQANHLLRHRPGGLDGTPLVTPQLAACCSVGRLQGQGRRCIGSACKGTRTRKRMCVRTRTAERAAERTRPATGICTLTCTQVVELLVQAQADVNVEFNGKSALTHAASNGRSDIVDLLVEAKADLSFKGPLVGHCAVSAAAGNGHVQAMQALIRSGSRRTRRNSEISAVVAAAFNGQVQAVRALRSAGADLSVVADNEFPVTGLMMAAWNDHVAVIEEFVKAGVDVNQVSTRAYGTQQRLSLCVIVVDSPSHPLQTENRECGQLLLASAVHRGWI